MNICKLSFFYLKIWVRFPFVHLTAIFLNNLFYLFIFLWFLTSFFIDFDGYYIVRTDEGQPKPKYIYLLYLLYRGLVHHHHRILNLYVLCLTKSCLMFVNVFQICLFQVSMCLISLFNNFLCLSIFILFVCRCKLSCLFLYFMLFNVCFCFSIHLFHIFHVSIFMVVLVSWRLVNVSQKFLKVCLMTVNLYVLYLSNWQKINKNVCINY